jgi:hypothetical protein
MNRAFFPVSAVFLSVLSSCSWDKEAELVEPETIFGSWRLQWVYRGWQNPTDNVPNKKIELDPGTFTLYEDDKLIHTSGYALDTIFYEDRAIQIEVELDDKLDKEFYYKTDTKKLYADDNFAADGDLYEFVRIQD